MNDQPTLDDALRTFGQHSDTQFEDSTHVDLLTDAGVRRTDFEHFMAAAAATDLLDAGVPDGPTENSRARSLARLLADYPMGGIDPREMLVSDAVAWVIVTLPDVPPDIPSAWTAYTPHGWLFHAAGLSVDEALSLPKGTQRSLRTLAALRGSSPPPLPRGTSLVWPRMPIVY